MGIEVINTLVYIKELNCILSSAHMPIVNLPSEEGGRQNIITLSTGCVTPLPLVPHCCPLLPSVHIIVDAQQHSFSMPDANNHRMNKSPFGGIAP
jgi:hypothetical protein